MMSPSEPPATRKNSPRVPKGFWQWNIATLLLLMAAVGVWTAYFRFKFETRRMDAELDSLTELARELVIDDPNQYAIVERYEDWDGEVSWNVYIPKGGRYVLKLATRGIGVAYDTLKGSGIANFPDSGKAVEITPGRHVVSLEKDFDGQRPFARVIVDGKLAVEAIEVIEWKPLGSHASAGGRFARSRQTPTSEPLEFFRLQFRGEMLDAAAATQGAGQRNGLLLWIERKE